METSEGGVNVAQLNHGLDAGDFGLSHAMQVLQIGLFLMVNNCEKKGDSLNSLNSDPCLPLVRPFPDNQEVLSADVSLSNCCRSSFQTCCEE